MLGNLTSIAANGAEVLVGPETSDDAGVYLFEGNGLVSTADFITPVCDDPARFGFVAAANSLSDVYAMGGKPLFALNLCAFPENVEHGVLKSILEGGAAALGKVGAALLGGHTVYDNELKYGLAVVGAVDPNRILTNTQARTGDRLVLTKPLGTGVMINAFKLSRIDADTLEPCLKEMERMNAEASAGALEHGAHACTDITGFGLAGHAWELANGSKKRLRIRYDALPVYDGFIEWTQKGVSTGATKSNEVHVTEHLQGHEKLGAIQRALLFDPQTSGGLLVSLPAEQSKSYTDALVATGHRAVEIGEVLDGEPGIQIV